MNEDISCRNTGSQDRLIRALKDSIASLSSAVSEYDSSLA